MAKKLELRHSDLLETIEGYVGPYVGDLLASDGLTSDDKTYKHRRATDAEASTGDFVPYFDMTSA